MTFRAQAKEKHGVYHLHTPALLNPCNYIPIPSWHIPIAEFIYYHSAELRDEGNFQSGRLRLLKRIAKLSIFQSDIARAMYLCCCVTVSEIKGKGRGERSPLLFPILTQQGSRYD